MSRTFLPSISIYILLFIPCLIIADPGVTPDYIHLSYQNDPSTTMTIMWRTSTGITGSVVQYGPTSSYSQQKTGVYALLPESRGNSHTVELTGLNPEWTYHYRVGDGGSNWSGDKIFTTMPDPNDLCAPITFVALGDSRSSVNHGAGSNWDNVMAQAVTHDPDFIVVTGDLINDGSYQEGGWETWFEFAESYIIQQPMLTSWGNHDMGGSGQYYLRNFALPFNSADSTENFYDFKAGPVHVFALDTGYGGSSYSTQTSWLNAKLNATDALWTFAFQHAPPYSSGSHGSSSTVRDTFGPIFDNYHLDIDFAGHDHHYERSKPIYDQSVVSDYGDGTMYIVTGGAGAPLYGFSSQWHQEIAVQTFHYVLIEIDFSQLSLKAYDRYGTLLDSVDIEKEELLYPEADFSVASQSVLIGELVSFDASASSDMCGSITDYAWDFDDSQDGDGQVVEHSFNQPAVYNVSLTVTDYDSYTDDFTLPITVSCPDCFVGGACVADGTLNPSNSCESCDPAQSTTNWSYLGDGAGCSDGLYCTVNDQCLAGTCGGEVRDCTTYDETCKFGQCDEYLDTCFSAPRPNGTPCDDQLFCTATDDCQGGACLGRGQTCSSFADQCNWGECDEDQDNCYTEPRPAGTPCDDNLNCTDNDQCLSGLCEGQLISCNDNVGCTIDSCDEATGCVNDPDDSLCDNSLWCDGQETCNSTAGCLDNADPCDPQTETCNEQQDQCEPLGGPNSLTITVYLHGAWDGSQHTCPVSLTVDLHHTNGDQIGALAYHLTDIPLSTLGQADLDLVASGVEVGSYYVVLRQENHVDLATDDPYAFSSGVAVFVDFSDPAQVECGTATLYDVSGRWTMPAGDIDPDNRVALSDFNYLRNNWTTTDSACDLDCDGFCRLGDFNKLRNTWNTQGCAP